MRTLLGLLLAIGLVIVMASCAPSPAAPAAPAQEAAKPAAAPAKEAPAAKPAAAPATAAPAAKPAAKPSGKFTIGTSSLGTAEAWLPWLETGREGWAVMGAFYESLVNIDRQSGDTVPMLAERWEIEEAGKRWRFFLRKGVQFHDGQGELTAPDVKFSVEQFMTDKAVASNAAVFKQLVDRVEVVNPYEVVLHLKQPSVTLLGRLTPNYFGIVSKKYVETAGERQATTKPVGTGPFKLIEHKRNQSATFEALDQHWRQTAPFKTLVVRQVADEAARLAMLRSGEIDVGAISFKFKREAEAAGLKLLRIQGAAQYHVHLGGQVLPSRETFDPKVPWVEDPKDPASRERALKVRKALNLAVDKQAIIKSVFEGEGVPSVVPFLAPGGDFVPPSLTPYPYDPAEAKRLLAEAGYAQGFPREIEMILMPWPGRAEMVDVGEAVAGFWERNLGLKVKRTPMDYAVFAPQVSIPRRTAWTTWAHGYQGAPLSEPAAAMGTWLTSKSAQNTVAEAPAIDDLSNKILAEANRSKRVELYRELAKAFYEPYHAVPVVAVPALYASNPKTVASWPLPPGDAYLSGYEYAMPVR
ncbi:MAG: ABC transporter substrate-binding protein [Chloroflexi bacterium]|nr:ABC transporter substrate-binding protein [Chloroflexota bacterium]